MLIVCFNINPLERRKRRDSCQWHIEADNQGLERWYVGGSIVLGMGVPIVPAALGHFGYDPVLEVW